MAPERPAVTFHHRHPDDSPRKGSQSAEAPDIRSWPIASVSHADLGDPGIFHRIRIGPFPNRATAQDICAQVKAAKLGCLVVRSK